MEASIAGIGDYLKIKPGVNSSGKATGKVTYSGKLSGKTESGTARIDFMHEYGGGGECYLDEGCVTICVNNHLYYFYLSLTPTLKILDP